MDASERMRALLQYANAAKVARGLTAKGYPVSGVTVSRWAHGKNVTPLAVHLVEELLGMTKAALPPAWATGLLEEMERLRRAMEKTEEEKPELRATDTRWRR